MDSLSAGREKKSLHFVTPTHLSRIVGDHQDQLSLRDNGLGRVKEEFNLNRQAVVNLISGDMWTACTMSWRLSNISKEEEEEEKEEQEEQEEVDLVVTWIWWPKLYAQNWHYLLLLLVLLLGLFACLFVGREGGSILFFFLFFLSFFKWGGGGVMRKKQHKIIVRRDPSSGLIILYAKLTDTDR